MSSLHSQLEKFIIPNQTQTRKQISFWGQAFETFEIQNHKHYNHLTIRILYLKRMTKVSKA